jgi:osmotically-inducible protein OsmY
MAAKRTDSEIHRDVIRELAWEWRVDETEVGVEVDGGVVTLTGTVDSWAKRMAAQDAAHRVRGVLDVANDIQVRQSGAPGHTDTEIAHAIRETLRWNAFVPHERLRSTVNSGNVTLEGDVENVNQRDAVERAVRNLSGVRLIVNLIEVKPTRFVRPEELRASILGALERHAERDTQGIHVDIDAGHVTLSGVVHSWFDREAVVEAARATHGVLDVKDMLTIQPYAAH